MIFGIFWPILVLLGIIVIFSRVLKQIQVDSNASFNIVGSKIERTTQRRSFFGNIGFFFDYLHSCRAS